jgi:predicted permease
VNDAAAPERFRPTNAKPGAGARVALFLTDLRLATRALVRAPAFAIAATVTMALGVGVNSVIFSAVNGVLLRPLDYPQPNELVHLSESSGRAGSSIVSGSTNSVSPANLMDYRRESHSFAGLASYALAPMNLTGGIVPRRVWADRVTADFFDVLRVRPELGRTMAAGEDAFGAPHVAIVSHALWAELGGDSTVRGHALRLDDEYYDVIGVLPPGFKAPNQDNVTDPIVAYVPAAFTPDLLSVDGHGDHEVDVVGRLAPTVTIGQAQADLARISTSLETAYQGTNDGVRAEIRPLRDAIVSNVRGALLVLLGAVAFVWLVACVNLANLMLVRAVGRQREVTVRVALGASRSRIVQALVAQGLVVALAGCVLGVVLGYALKGALLWLAPPEIPRLDAIAFDVRVFLVTAALSVVAGIGFGLVPGWFAARTQPADALRAGERNMGRRSVLQWQRGLVIVEIALSFALVVGSGLLLRSFASVIGVELGFRTDNVIAVGVTLPATRYADGDARLRFFEALDERLRVMPGVSSVAYANRLPMRGGWSSGLQIDDAASDSTVNHDTDIQAVSPGYFATFGMTLVRGRGLEPSDRKGSLAIGVVNEAFARRFLTGTDALGRRFRRGSSGPWITIVGVVTDVRRGGKTAPILAEAYLSAAQTNLYPVVLGDVAVRTAADPYALVPAIREAVLAIDPNQPIANVRTMNDVVSRTVAMRRFETLLIAIFGATALALALVGIFGVISYAVTQRTREFGIRVALGAQRGQVLRHVLVQAAWLVAAGLGAGFVCALWISSYLERMLFAITPTDPPTYAAVAVTFVLVALAACVAPARRAAGADPVRALKYE